MNIKSIEDEYGDDKYKTDKYKKVGLSQYDKMLKMPIPELIVSLSIPSIISMLVSNIYNLVDTAFVGRIGTSASGAVGVVFGFMAIIQAVGFMLGQGSGSIISRALGQRDVQRASENASMGFLASFFFGALISLIGFIWIDDIISLLGSTPTIAPFAKTYIIYILIASPFMSSSLTLSNILRYEGKATLGMIGLIIGGVLNMIGDPILMFVMKMGIAGAGLSTALSQIISWGILLLMFISGRTECRISLPSMKEVYSTDYIVKTVNIMVTGLPSLIRQGLGAFTSILSNTSCAVYGDAAVAAMSIVSRMLFFSFSVALGIGQGFQPVAGYNYGAKKYDRLKKAFIFTCLAAELIIIIACIPLFIFPSRIISIFRDDMAVIEIGTRALVLSAAALLFLPPAMATEMLFQSTGRKLLASTLSAMRGGLIFIPLLLVLAEFRGLSGIQEAQPLSMFIAFPLTMPFAIAFFKRIGKSKGQEYMQYESVSD